jgi:hypothetical protein
VPLFLPFDGSVTLSGDIHYGIQSVGTGARLEARVAGPAALGAAVTLQGSFLDVDYLPVSPMLRLHFEQVGVGLRENGLGQDDFRLRQVHDELVLERRDADGTAMVAPDRDAGSSHLDRCPAGIATERTSHCCSAHSDGCEPVGPKGSKSFCQVLG